VFAKAPHKMNVIVQPVTVCYSVIWLCSPVADKLSNFAQPDNTFSDVFISLRELKFVRGKSDTSNIYIFTTVYCIKCSYTKHCTPLSV